MRNVSEMAQALALKEQNAATSVPGKRTYKPRAKTISKLVRDACELIASGECKGATEAAERLGCSRPSLSRALNRDHVKDYLVSEARREISASVFRAAKVKVKLLNAVSEKVQSEVASELLAMAHIAAPKQPGVTINNNVSVSSGYIIDLSDKPEGDVRRELEAQGVVIDDVGAT